MKSIVVGVASDSDVGDETTEEDSLSVRWQRSRMVPMRSKAELSVASGPCTSSARSKVRARSPAIPGLPRPPPALQLMSRKDIVRMIFMKVSVREASVDMRSMACSTIVPSALASPARPLLL